MIKIYGINNCDTMRKARRWLDEHGVEYRFHDFKKQGLEKSLLLQWEAAVGWETLLNRRGMMWRKLTPQIKGNIDQASALAVMLETPSIIKRPVLDRGGEIHVGFTEQNYGQLFGQ